MANGSGSLNRVQYGGLDFDTYNDDLRARLQVLYGKDFNDFAVSSLGTMLLDLTAFGLDALSFYLDRRASDSYLATARTRKSVAKLARQLGYKMGGAVASSVDVEISVINVYVFNVVIPKGFQLKGPDNLIFEVAEATTFTPSEQGLGKTKPLPCYEGETITETFVSDGTSSQAFQLRRVPTNKFVVEGAVVGKVDGAEWEVVDLIQYGATDQFEVGFNDDPPTVRFGDGVSGNIPKSGATIEVAYVASRGKSGQVAANTITAVVIPLVVGFTNISLSITNAEGSVGGDDREAMSSAKAFAPQVFKSREVAVVGGDYEALAGRYADPLFGRVAVAKAISARSSASDLTVQNYLQDIVDGLTILNTELSAQVAAIIAAEDLLDPEVGMIATEAGSIAGHMTTIQTEANSVVVNSRGIKNSAGEIFTDSSDIQVLVVDGKATVDAITTHLTTSQLTIAAKDAIKAYFDRISSEAASIGTASGTSIPFTADAAIVDANSILAEVGMIGTDVITVGTHLKQVADSSSIIGTQSVAIRNEILVVDTANTTLVNTVSLSQTGIETHLDRLLAADCKANLVIVPILTRDAGGFYAAPSSGLIDSLQTYLEARKEVTQTVSVTSGIRFLLPVVLRVRIGVKEGYSEAVVLTTAQAAIEGLLRDRSFGKSLYESDLDDVVLPSADLSKGVAGVGFVINRILGHLAPDGVTLVTTNLDSDGNLIAGERWITKGTISITTEIMPS